ncbi:MAG: SIR2 family protein [Pleomorphochaeta sp.]
MKDVLFLGNGINRLSENYSWEQLVKSLIYKFYSKEINVNTENKPFSLLYEEILSHALSKSKGNEQDIRKHIVSEIKKIGINDFHKKIIKYDFAAILTTNYDYLIEKAFDSKSNFKNTAKVQESKYNILRKNEVDNINIPIWHIHGELRRPQTITLGYEHYSGYLENLRTSVTQGKAWENFELKRLSDRLNSKIIDTWVDYFFCYNIHIMGFSFDFSEIDLWWLLVFRSRMINLKKRKYNITNKIYFYYAEENNSIINSRVQILKSLGVIPICNLLMNNWEDYYYNLFNKDLKVEYLKK